MFEISPIPAFKDNYIWLLARGTQAFVVDPGDASPVIARLVADGLDLAGILVTHHHADHQGGIAALCERYQPAVYAPAIESITGTTHPLKGGETLDILGSAVQVLAVPGHTLGHLAYLAPGALFCGDTLFGAGCGRLFEGTPAQMHDSLSSIAALPDETLIYCAHEYTEMNLRFALTVEPGNLALRQRADDAARLRAAGRPTVPSTLASEKASNPFLRCTQPAVITAALKYAEGMEIRAGNRGDVSAVAVFAALRAWRNVF
jgi:hydroxyacylglutathione hydrolase